MEISHYPLKCSVKNVAFKGSTSQQRSLDTNPDWCTELKGEHRKVNKILFCYLQDKSSNFDFKP